MGVVHPEKEKQKQKLIEALLQGKVIQNRHDGRYACLSRGLVCECGNHSSQLGILNLSFEDPMDWTLEEPVKFFDVPVKINGFGCMNITRNGVVYSLTGAHQLQSFEAFLYTSLDPMQCGPDVSKDWILDRVPIAIRFRLEA